MIGENRATLPYTDGVKTALVLRSARLSSVLAVVYAMAACSGTPHINLAKEVTTAQLTEYLCRPGGHYSTMFRGVAYAGSDSRFDYIVLTRRNQRFH